MAQRAALALGSTIILHPFYYITLLTLDGVLFDLPVMMRIICSIKKKHICLPGSLFFFFS